MDGISSLFPEASLELGPEKKPSQASQPRKTYIPEEDELLHHKPQEFLLHLGLIVQQVVNQHVDNVGAVPAMSVKHPPQRMTIRLDHRPAELPSHQCCCDSSCEL